MTHIQNIKQVTDDSTWKGERELFGNALVIPSKIWNRRPFDCEESDPTWSEKNVGGFTINDAYKPSKSYTEGILSNRAYPQH